MKAWSSRCLVVLVAVALASAGCGGNSPGGGTGGGRDGGTGSSGDGTGSGGDGSGSGGMDSGTTSGGDTGTMSGGDTGTMSGGDTGGGGMRDTGSAGDGGFMIGTRTCTATEICDNGMDDNCNGQADEGCSCLPGMTQQCFVGDPAQAGVGVCNFGSQRCLGSNELGVWGECMGSGHPLPVVCGGGMDYLCDGAIDEGCACVAGAMRACYDGPPGTRHVGTCADGVQRCIAMGSTAMWGPCEGEVLPTPAQCDGIDHQCNEMPNMGCNCMPGARRACYDGPPGTAGVGLCHAGTQLCVENPGGGSDWGACTGEVTPTSAVCDGMDHACDGRPFAACGCTPGATRTCYDGPAGTAGVGLCHAGTQTCTVMGTTPGWGPCTGQVLPAANVCDGVDRACTGMPIAGACACVLGAARTCYTGPTGTAGVGLCRTGSQTCVAGPGGAGSAWSGCVGEITPTPNACDGVDRMCNGMPLAGACACVLGTSRPCYDGPAGTAGVGVCHGGSQLCITGPGGVGSAWGACNGEILPSANTCDGVDRMCNGMPNAGCTCTIGQTRVCYDGPPATRGLGICRDGMQSCVASGATSAWQSACGGETLPATEICGNGIDDNCNGMIDDGCGPRITCPADVTVNAGTATTLTATASSPGRTISGYSWTITAAPSGGIGTPNQWAPTPPTAMTETFLAYIPGIYTIHVTATDSAGTMVGCDAHVTALGHGLRVEMLWNGIGDVDLHLHNGVTGTAWFNGTNDCYYSNCPNASTGIPRLPWDAAGTNDDPILDFDNTTSNGPENTRIDSPVIGEAYTIGVHNYYNAAGRTVTVHVYCGGVTSPTQTFTSTPLTGGGTGGQQNDGTFWKVASVVFSSMTSCSITPLNNYSTAATRYGTF